MTSIGTTNNSAAIGAAQAATDRSLERLSSGSRINSAADDAAGLAISNRQNAQILGFNQATRNANDGISLVQVADGNLQSVSDNLQRLRELSVQAANGSLNDSDRSALNAEAQQLTNEITRIVETSNFNGQPLLSSDQSLDLQVGSNAGDTISIETENFLQQLENSGFNNVDLSTTQSASNALTTIDNILNNVNEQRSNLGAISNRLDSTINQLQQSSINTSEAQSRITDADFAREASELVRNQIIEQAAIAVQSQANQRSGLALQLLTDV